MFEPTSTLMAPSTSQLIPLRRAPLMERLARLVRPMPTSSDRLLETPGTSVASCMKLRLLSGSSCTWVGPIKVCTAAVGWMSCAAAEISTVSLMPPVFITMSS